MFDHADPDNSSLHLYLGLLSLKSLRLSELLGFRFVFSFRCVDPRDAPESSRNWMHPSRSFPSLLKSPVQKARARLFRSGRLLRHSDADGLFMSMTDTRFSKIR